jgi:hypothetical protein
MDLKELATKTQILEGAGYRCFDREVYFNRQTKKAFSVEFVEGRSEDEIERLIRDDAPNTSWRFFFIKPPSAAVERELANVLG